MTVEIWRPLTGRPLPDKAVGPHLILVGMDFVPRRVSGDKNFWYELIHALSGAISRITIISLDPSPEIRHKMVDYFCVAEMPICLRRLPTKLLRWGTSLSNRGGTFPHGLAVVEKMVSCVSLWQEIRAVQRPLEPTQVHLMDNLGPINPLLATVLNIPVSVSAIAFNGRRPPGIQKLYALLSFLHPKIRAIPYTRAYQERLRSWGIKAVHHIPWGVDTRLPLPSAEAKTQAKALLQLDPALPLYVWSGFIQQIDEADFHLAVRQARAAMDKGLRATFFFAFKSACYNNNYGAWHAPERGIIVKGTSVAEFEQLRLAADVFYSPFSQQSHIIGPPLTWIEFMAQGVPIVTTAVGGVEEIISQGRTGFIAPEPNLLPEMLLAVRDCSREMRNDCQDEMRHQRDLRLIAQKYLKLWFGDKQ